MARSSRTYRWQRSARSAKAASRASTSGRRAMRGGNSAKVCCDGERQRQAPVVGIVYSLSGRPRVGVGQVGPASRWFLLFLIFWARQQKKTPMPDDGRANVPDGTGSGILDEVTLRALLEHVPVTVYIDRLDETASNVYTSPRLESELGYTVEEWVTDKDLYAKVLHPEDRDRILAEYRRTRDTDEPFRGGVPHDRARWDRALVPRRGDGHSRRDRPARLLSWLPARHHQAEGAGGGASQQPGGAAA